MLSNYDLATAVDEPNNLESPMFVHHYSDGKWKLKNSNGRGIQLEDPEATFNAVQDLIFKHQYHLNFVDFDLHLEDVQYDWQNTKLNALIDEFDTISLDI